MATRLFRSRRLVSRRIGAGIVLLTVASAVLLVATIWLFASLRERQQSVAQSVREDAIWAAFQADRGASRLLEAALDPGQGTPENVTLQFDLLYSRIDLLGGGKYAIAFGESAGVADKAQAVTANVLALVPIMDAIVADASVLETGRASILDGARQIQESTGALLVAANAAVNAMRVAERADTLATYWRIGAAVAALTLVLVLIVALLAAQLVHISRSGREIELLSMRNARSAAAAQAASKAKSSFLATMSHEIRTPLNGIIGMADIINDSVLTEQQRKQLHVIRQSGYVLLDVINDVLDYSKLEAGAVSIDKRSFPLSEIMESVRAILEPRAENAGIALSVDYPDVNVTTDPARLRQILINLTGNAVKFTSRGQVAISAEIQGDHLVCQVVDTGQGIAQADIPRLFKDFSQLDSSSTRSHGGTGLGLAICKRLTEALGGVIGVESEFDRGSRFWIDLPVSPVNATTPVVRPAATAAISQATGTALIVDDNAVNRIVAGTLLERMGYAVTFATNGQEALDSLGVHRPDVVFMDMQMPLLDGLEATRRARAAGITTAIIGLTANAFDTDRRTCLSAGMDGFVAKPVTRDKLVFALASLRPGSGNADPESGVDSDYQSVLIGELGRSVFDDLVAKFRNDAVGLINEALAARGQDDLARLDDALHAIKGASLTLGFTDLANGAEKLRLGTPVAADIEKLRRLAA